VISPQRDIVAHHEAGHAVVGRAHGLRFSRVYLGDASGQVVFDEQWDEATVLGDPGLLDRYALMLLAGAAAEWRHAGVVLGATGDIAALCWLLARARARGTAPRADRWRRAAAQVAGQWPAIAALADELAHRSAPVNDLPAVLARFPHLGTTVDELTWADARRQPPDDRKIIPARRSPVMVAGTAAGGPDG
jgi:hypothetical protein